MTLIEFLLARIAEDEEAARSAPGDSWEVDSQGCCVLPAEDDWMDNIETHGNGSAGHIARWDPARVLIECKAKRGVIMANAPYDDIQVRRQTRDLAGATLRLLALPYASHPDYDESWRP